MKGKTHQRIIGILRYLDEKTSPSEPINIKEMQQYLGDDSAQRQVLYNDFKQLELAGAGISHDKNKHYYYDNKRFSEGELELLADVICSSSFLDSQRAEQLLVNIKQMTNMERFDDISKLTNVYLRTKSLNPDCIENIRLLHKAILNEKKIEFVYAHYIETSELYYEYIADDKNEYISVCISPKTDESGNNIITETTHVISPEKNIKSPYTISPCKLVWDNSQCYVIGYYSAGEGQKECIRIFRADKIFRLKICESKVAPVRSSDPFYSESKDGFDDEKYMHSIFGMFGSKDNKLEKVKFKVSKKLIGAMAERFGFDTVFSEIDEDHLAFSADIQISFKFYGWVASFEPDDLSILYPRSVREDFLKHLTNIISCY